MHTITRFTILFVLGACSQSHGMDGRDGGRRDGGRRDGGGMCCPIDAGSPSGCDGLAPAACISNFECVPTYDDVCCSHCVPGPCADCTNIQYERCVTLEQSQCRGGDACGFTPPWNCGPAAPNCEAASVIDTDSCTTAGCVPSYPSGEGDPDPSAAFCTAILGTSCTAACEIEPPPCPSGTVAEGNGGCWTSRCIPSFVCG